MFKKCCGVRVLYVAITIDREENTSSQLESQLSALRDQQTNTACRVSSAVQDFSNFQNKSLQQLKETQESLASTQESRKQLESQMADLGKQVNAIETSLVNEKCVAMCVVYMYLYVICIEYCIRRTDHYLYCLAYKIIFLQVISYM